MRDIFTYPKPPFASAKRWRPPHPSLVLFAVMFMAACGGGGGNSAPAAPVVPPKLSITPTGGEAIVLDGAKIIPEETDGSRNTPISLGKLTDDKDESGDAVYHLAEGDDATGTDNSDFRITNNVLFYKGAAVDFESATKKSFNIKIVSYKNAEDAEAGRSPQTLDSTINLQDQIEVLSVMNAEGDIIASDGEGLLPENLDGSTTPQLLGTIIDNIKTTLPVSYRLAAASASNDNGFFEIDAATGQIYYKGPVAGDFENPVGKKKFTIDIIRTIDGIAATDQTLPLVINLKDVDDEKPTLTVEAGEAVNGILYDVSDTFGVSPTSGLLKITLNNVPLSSNSLIIELNERNDRGPFTFVVTYQDPNDPTSIVEKITIGYGGQLILGKDAFVAALKSAIESDTNFERYFDDIVLAEDSTTTGIFRADDTFSVTGDVVAGFRVAADTTGVIADFSSTDPDSDLNDLEYSVSDETNFQINSDGELRFAEGTNAPTYDSTIPANNIRAITVTVSDGTNTNTYPIQIEVLPPASESIQTAGESAAEAVVPDTDDSTAPEATKPSIGRRILDYLFGSQEEHRQMQNQQMENMFGDSDLDPITPQDPDML